MANNFEILSFGQRGLGQSNRPDICYSMEDYTDDVASLLKTLDWEGWNIIGVSFEGMVAQELALRHAHCVGRLVLCCTSSGGAGGHSYPLHAMTNLSNDEFSSLSVAIACRFFFTGQFIVPRIVAETKFTRQRFSLAYANFAALF